MSQNPDHGSKYNPASKFDPLADSNTDTANLLHILFDEASPVLDQSILGELERDSVIQELLSVRCYLRQKFRRILEVANLPDVASQFVPLGQNHDARIPSVHEICRSIENPELRDQVRSRLSDAKASLTADILERLGFVSEEIFDRREYARTDDGKIDGIRWMDMLDEIVLQNSAMSMRLSEWRDRVNREFAGIVNQAFSGLNELRKPLIPKDTFRQPFEMSSDLAGKSLPELLNIFLDNDLQLRRRLDALYMMMFSLAFFKIQNDPVFQAQNWVHGEILNIFEENVWPGSTEHADFRVRRVHGRNVFRLTGSKDASAKDDSKAVARKVSTDVSEIFKDYEDILDNPDYVFFDSRTKSAFSIIIKLFLMQESVRQALHRVQGFLADMFPEKDDALRKIREIENLMRTLHHPEVDLATKPVDTKIIRDNVGITFAIPVRKSLSRMRRHEKARLTRLMNDFAEYLIGILGLEKDPEPDVRNNLWKVDRTRNASRNARFREFKIYGLKKIIYNGREVKVPIEIQIQPFETYSLARSPGSAVGHHAYYSGKAKNLQRRFMPHRVSGREVYPPVRSQGLMEVMAPAEHMVSTSPTS